MKFDNRGVSPVVGTILLIAITVAIAGVIGYFAMTQSPGEPAPTVSVEFENVQSGDYGGGDGVFTITHLGGDNVSTDDLSVKVDGEPQSFSSSGGDSFGVGDVITVPDTGTFTLESDNKIILSHTPSDSAIASTEVD